MVRTAAGSGGPGRGVGRVTGREHPTGLITHVGDDGGDPDQVRHIARRQAGRGVAAGGLAVSPIQLSRGSSGSPLDIRRRLLDRLW